MQLRRRTNIHEWINSAGVIVAILLSSATAYISWRAEIRKHTIIAAESEVDYSCPVAVAKLTRHDSTSYFITMCWTITLHNQSEIRQPIVHMDTEGSYDLPFVEMHNDILDDSGKPIKMPFMLDAGEARRLTLRRVIRLPKYRYEEFAANPKFMDGKVISKSFREIVWGDDQPKEFVIPDVGTHNYSTQYVESILYSTGDNNIFRVPLCLNHRPSMAARSPRDILDVIDRLNQIGQTKKDIPLIEEAYALLCI